MEKSNNYHALRCDKDFGGKNTNAVLCDYHSIILHWQLKNKKIATKSYRKKIYDRVMKENNIY